MLVFLSFFPIFGSFWGLLGVSLVHLGRPIVVPWTIIFFSDFFPIFDQAKEIFSRIFDFFPIFGQILDSDQFIDQASWSGLRAFG